MRSYRKNNKFRIILTATSKKKTLSKGLSLFLFFFHFHWKTHGAYSSALFRLYHPRTATRLKGSSVKMLKVKEKHTKKLRQRWRENSSTNTDNFSSFSSHTDKKALVVGAFKRAFTHFSSQLVTSFADNAVMRIFRDSRRECLYSKLIACCWCCRWRQHTTGRADSH